MVQKLLMARSDQGGSQSYTTPGTYYWTAPAGVTKVDVTGQGGSRSSGTLTWVNHSAPSVFIGSSCGIFEPYSSSLTYQSLYSAHSSTVNTANSITTSSSGANYSGLVRTTYRLWCSTTSQWGTCAVFSYSGTLRRIGTFSANSTLAGLSGTISTPPSSVNYGASGGTIQRLLTTYTYGTNSTAFGQTFPHNTSQSTVTDISVTAGTQYTIVVGTDQGADTAFVSFDYY